MVMNANRLHVRFLLFERIFLSSFEGYIFFFLCACSQEKVPRNSTPVQRATRSRSKGKPIWLSVRKSLIFDEEGVREGFSWSTPDDLDIAETLSGVRTPAGASSCQFVCEQRGDL